MNNQILALKNNLRQAREKVAELSLTYSAVMVRQNEEIDAIKAKYCNDNKELFTDFESWQDDAADMEVELRAALIANFNETGEKTFDSQLSVRVTEKVEITDDGKALAWAETNAPFLIEKSVNRKQFDPIAKSYPEQLEFVTIAKTPTAVIAKDLSEVAV